MIYLMDLKIVFFMLILSLSYSCSSAGDEAIEEQVSQKSRIEVESEDANNIYDQKENQSDNDLSEQDDKDTNEQNIPDETSIADKNLSDEKNTYNDQELNEPDSQNIPDISPDQEISNEVDPNKIDPDQTNQDNQIPDYTDQNLNDSKENDDQTTQGSDQNIEQENQSYMEASEMIDEKKENYHEYYVVPNDTLFKISLKINKNRDWKNIISYNNIENPNKIFPGDKLKIKKNENSDKFFNKLKIKKIKIEKGDTLSSIAYKELGNASAWKTIAKINEDKIKDPNMIKVGQVITIFTFS